MSNPVEPQITQAMLEETHPEIRNIIPKHGPGNWCAQIEEGWVRLSEELAKCKGIDLANVHGPQTLINRLHRYKSLEVIFRVATRDRDDTWSERADENKELFDSLLNIAAFQVDLDEDGEISDEEERVDTSRNLVV